MNPDEMLRTVGEGVRTYNADSWTSLLRHMIDTLTDWLGYEVEIDPENNGCVNEGGGFCLDILRGCPSETDLLWWKGILGATIIEDRIRVSLVMFYYSGTQRLVAKDGKEFSEYVYEANGPGKGEWKLHGWFEDTFGEYEQI